MKRIPAGGTKTPCVPLEQARSLSLDLVELLRDVCLRIEIAGSVRRCVPLVKDIEIVCIPRLVAPGGKLFDDGAEKVSAVDGRVAHLTTELGGNTQLSFCRQNPCNGPRQKRLVYGGVKIDLFCVLPPAEWGVIFAIRTGPAGSHMLVKRKSWGGLCPDNCCVKEGQLWWDGRPTPCPEEQNFFAKLGLPWTAPEGRTGARLAYLLQGHSRRR
jgi:DNA polymerase/3'-5' exonuclease PolX